MARKATLVSVKHAATYFDFLVAVELVAQDIYGKERDKKAVLVTATAQSPKDFPDDQKAKWEEMTLDVFNKVWIAGVPTVHASGNDADVAGREDIDEVPMLYETKERPFINVCGNDYDGGKTSWAQGGEHVTLYAPDTKIPCQTKKDGTKELDGTSYGES